MTPQEVKLWVRLRQLRELGFHFCRQSPIPPYIVDFECRRWRLIVEVDGGQHGFDEISRTTPTEIWLCKRRVIES